MDLLPTYQLEVLRNVFCKIAGHQVGSDCLAASRFFIKFLKFYRLQAQSDLQKQETALETINKVSKINPKNALSKYQKSRILIILLVVFQKLLKFILQPFISKPLQLFVQNEKLGVDFLSLDVMPVNLLYNVFLAIAKWYKKDWGQSFFALCSLRMLMMSMVVNCFCEMVDRQKWVNHAGIYLLKVNDENTRTRCEICSELTIKTRERHQVFLLLTLNIFHTLL